MKNQNDMIISIVAVVLALIIAGVLFATQPEVAAQVPVAPITTTDAPMPTADVVKSAALPNAGSGGGAMGGVPGAPMAGGMGAPLAGAGGQGLKGDRMPRPGGAGGL